jgi:predicted DNA-binding transcriptional regulator AlpA
MTTATLTARHFATILGIGRVTFQHLLATGQLPPPRWHGSKVWAAATVAGWLSDRLGRPVAVPLVPMMTAEQYRQRLGMSRRTFERQLARHQVKEPLRLSKRCIRWLATD